MTLEPLVVDDSLIPPVPPLPGDAVDPGPPPPLPASAEDGGTAGGVDSASTDPTDEEADATVDADLEVEVVENDSAASGDEVAPDVLASPVGTDDEPADDLARGATADDTAVAAPAVDSRSWALSLPNDASVGTPAVAIRGLIKQFGDTRAVDEIDLEIPAGIFYGIVGPNGAGKTTTLSMITGLLRPDRGSIEVAGLDVTRHAKKVKRAIGILPDRLRIFDRLTGRQLLYYYGVLRGLKRRVVEQRTIELAKALDLTDSLGRLVSDYSAGMTKKLMLAGALIHAPRVVVLDEPFEAVDPASSQTILDILTDYVEHGGTVVLSSHGMALIERVCARVAIMVSGQILAEGTVDEVRGEVTLEERFVDLAGGLGDVEGLEWLHTFSD